MNGSIKSRPPTSAAIDKGQMKVLVGNCRLVDRHLMFRAHRVVETINQVTGFLCQPCVPSCFDAEEWD